MTEVERIADQLKRAMTGEAWHGPALEELLEGMAAEQAATRPIKEAHSVWELVRHITTWLNACRRRLEGERAQPADEENFPPVTDTSETMWKAARATLKQTYLDFSAAISLLDDSRLEQPILEGMNSVYVTLHGAIQHTLYHAGQIAILKKALPERPTT